MENVLKITKIVWDYLIPLFISFGNIYFISMFFNYSVENAMDFNRHSQRIKNRCDTMIKIHAISLVLLIVCILNKVLGDFNG